MRPPNNFYTHNLNLFLKSVPEESNREIMKAYTMRHLRLDSPIYNRLEHRCVNLTWDVGHTVACERASGRDCLLNVVQAFPPGRSNPKRRGKTINETGVFGFDGFILETCTHSTRFTPLKLGVVITGSVYSNFGRIEEDSFIFSLFWQAIVNDLRKIG